MNRNEELYPYLSAYVTILFHCFESKLWSPKWLERNVAHEQAGVGVKKSNNRTNCNDFNSKSEKNYSFK